MDLKGTLRANTVSKTIYSLFKDQKPSAGSARRFITSVTFMNTEQSTSSPTLDQFIEFKDTIDENEVGFVIQYTYDELVELRNYLNAFIQNNEIFQKSGDQALIDSDRNS